MRSHALHPRNYLFTVLFTLAAALALCFRATSLRAELDDLEAEERVKKLLVSELDVRLPREALAGWLARVAGPKAKVFWEVNDCGEQTGDPAADANDESRDFPACVQASVFLPDRREFGVLISVGTWQKGFVGKPAVQHVYWAEGQQTHSLARLSEIPVEIKNGAAEETEDAVDESAAAQ